MPIIYHIIPAEVMNKHKTLFKLALIFQGLLILSTGYGLYKFVTPEAGSTFTFYTMGCYLLFILVIL